MPVRGGLTVRYDCNMAIPKIPSGTPNSDVYSLSGPKALCEESKLLDQRAARA